MVGFSTGTSTLMGPVRWVASLVRRWGWPVSAEVRVVVAIIVLFVLGSAALALWLTRVTLRTSQWHVRFGVPALAVLAAASCFWLWITLGMLGASGGPETSAGRFTFGPYPSSARLLALKAEGYTGVISLLHPAIPFERKLLADEKETAAKVGLEFIHVPLLYWVSENAESLDRFREVLKRPSGRYYVHCYLGRDRILAVKAIVEQESSTGVETTESVSSLSPVKAFESGDVYVLDNQVYLTPYPTDEEFTKYIPSGGVRQVVALLDESGPGRLPWIEKERLLLSGQGVLFQVIALPNKPYDPYQVLEAARKVRNLPRPLVVHGYPSPSLGRAPAAEAFLQAFRSNLPPLPPSLFKEAGKRGVEVIAPNIAGGPSPDGPEFMADLSSYGVREFVFLGDPESAEAKKDRAFAAQATQTLNVSFNWQAVSFLDPGSLNKFARGGPWYLYGPFLPAFKTEVARRFGPAVPEKVTWNQTASDSDESFLSRFFQRTVPPVRTIVLLGPILLFAVAVAGSFVAWLWLKRQISTPYTRKVFHFVIFTSAGALHLLGGLPMVVLFGSIVSLVVFYAVFRGREFPLYEALARPTDQPHRTFFVLVPWLTTVLGGLATNLLFGRLAYIGYLVSGWGDAVGEPVGTAWGKHRYAVPSLVGVGVTRSVEGSAAVMLVGILAAFAGLVAGGVTPGSAWKVAALCGLAGTATEAVSNHGLDNFTIQLVAAGTAYWFLG